MLLRLRICARICALLPVTIVCMLVCTKHSLPFANVPAAAVLFSTSDVLFLLLLHCSTVGEQQVVTCAYLQYYFLTLNMLLVWLGISGCFAMGSWLPGSYPWQLTV
jgi:hypothetical protein